ncbi:MAG: hypothetical protein IMF18_13210 [Proteobacteria bacterium]|nr:hypothetical protein [Pseudomonadota bacterium]
MESHEFIRDEIKFFMEKAFQFAYIYIGSAFAILAGGKLDVFKGLAAAAGSGTDVIMVLGLLVLNLAYLILASSCLFAVLKRGYFILIQGERSCGSPVLEWERFVRIPATLPRRIDWNVDNYFMGVLYGLVWASSLALLVYAVQNSHGGMRWCAIGLGLLYCIPMWNTLNTVRLNGICRDEVLKTRNTKPEIQPTDALDDHSAVAP